MSKVPAFDAATIDGLITALRSPAVNVRAIGFEGLKARGASAVDAVAALLNDPNPYMRGRAIYLLYQLGSRGATARRGARVVSPIRRCASPPTARCGARVSTCCRSPRALARDTDAGVRREVALSMRDQPADSVAGHPGRRRARLRRAGSQLPRSAGHRRHRQGAGALRPAAPRARRQGRSAGVVADIHVDRVAAARAGGGGRPDGARRVVEAVARRSPLALDTLAFIKDPAASKAMLSFAEPNSALREPATLWLLNRMSNDWARLRPARRRSRRPASTIPTRSR